MYGAAADGFVGEVIRGGFVVVGLGGDMDVGDLLQEWGVDGLGGERDGVCVDHFDFFHPGDLGVLVLRRLVQVGAELDVVGGDGRAVVEFGVVPQVEGVGQAVCADLVAGGDARLRLGGAVQGDAHQWVINLVADVPSRWRR